MKPEWKYLTDIELVAHAKSLGWEIQVCICNVQWFPWEGKVWEQQKAYRGRPYQPKTKTIKMGAYFDGVTLFWYNETYPLIDKRWTRIPSEDKTIEVPL